MGTISDMRLSGGTGDEKTTFAFDILLIPSEERMETLVVVAHSYSHDNIAEETDTLRAITTESNVTENHVFPQKSADL